MGHVQFVVELLIKYLMNQLLKTPEMSVFKHLTVQPNP